MSRLFAAVLLIASAATLPVAAEPPDQSRFAREVTIATAEELQQLFAQPVEDILVWVRPGEYHLTPRPYTDPTCGNCQPAEFETETKTTVGLHLRGGRIHLRGMPDEERPVIHTNAGYGILIEDCNDCLIERLVVTGGARSSDGRATDGAVFVRNANVRILDNHIVENLGDPEAVRETVSGVIGIVGREGSNMTIRNNRITRNSWDAIALYREATATIIDNLIDGVDAATGANVGGGRGVGIGITWNAKASVRGNLIKNYWKGIGVFVDATAEIEGNVVEDILTWGIALWSAGENNASAHIVGNVVHRTGACGVSLASASTREDAGRLEHNAIARSGQNPAYDPSNRYCHQCALAVHRVPEHFAIKDNFFFANRRGSDELPDHDVGETEFRAAIAELCRTMSNHHVLRESAFVREFCDIDDEDH